MKIIHPDPYVDKGIKALLEALSFRQRMTGIESVLIIRESTGRAWRALNGQPGISEDMTDEKLLKIFSGEES